MLPAKLDYLFVAEFKDGSRYHQDHKDASREHPLTKSAFYDVCQRGLENVSEFRLVNCKSEHSVSLIDGHFKTDGRIVPSPYGELTNYRLIYFRRMNANFEGGFVKRPEVASYFIGWQANDANGKNFQMMLEIPPPGMGQSKIERKG